MISKIFASIVILLLFVPFFNGGNVANRRDNMRTPSVVTTTTKPIPTLGTAYSAYRFTDDSANTENSRKVVLEALKPNSDYTVKEIKTEMAIKPNDANKMTISLESSDMEMDINIESAQKVYKLDCGNGFVIYFDFEKAEYTMIA